MRIRFERGTLVCEPEDDREDLSKLPGAVWDDEARAWRVAAARYAELARWLVARDVRISDTLPGWQLAVSWQVPVLHWYQALALARWRAAEFRGVIAMPTGPATMMVALAAMSRLGLTTLCLVPDLRLLETWRTALAAGTGLSIGKLGDGAAELAPITVATYAGAAVWAPQLGDRYGLVIVDEAHRVGAGCPAEILELLVAPARLGLTALVPEAPARLERGVGPTVYERTAAEPLVPDVPSVPPGVPGGPSGPPPLPDVTRRTMGLTPLHAAIDRALIELVTRSQLSGAHA